jgi:hypothetical protein
MSDTPTPTDSTHRGTSAAYGPAHRGSLSDPGRRARCLATYYRLQRIILEARVRALEAELERRERQLDEAVAQYEQLLQRPTEDWVVTTSYGPDIEPDDD